MDHRREVTQQRDQYSAQMEEIKQIYAKDKQFMEELVRKGGPENQ